MSRQRRGDETIAQLARLAQEHRVELIAIGNGTASRETHRLSAELIRLHPEFESTKVVVSGGRRLGLLRFGFCFAGVAGASTSLRKLANGARSSRA